MTGNVNTGWIVFVVVVMLLACKGLFDACAAGMEWVVNWHDSRHPQRYVRPMEGQWFALAGHRLELGDTGFWIHFSAHRELGRQLVLFSPEGRSVACGPEHMLDELKQHAEVRAANRAEFAAVKESGKGARA